MSNLTKFEDGRNSVIEEMKILGPDAREAMGRYEAIEEALERHARELGAALSAARVAVGAINVDIQMLREETKDNTAELERRLEAIDSGAARLGYEFLRPALRVVVPLGEKGA